MKLARPFVVAVLALTLALAAGRVALVVGNNTYTHIGRLTTEYALGWGYENG